jgi:hypothetical protein
MNKRELQRIVNGIAKHVDQLVNLVADDTATSPCPIQSMFYTYNIMAFGAPPPGLGLYVKAGHPPVVVTLDENQKCVALSSDKQAIRDFETNMLGFVEQQYVLVKSDSYLDA